jgi:acetyl esterase/lipase
MTSILDRPAPPPDVTVTYGPLPEHVIDLRLPAQAPAQAQAQAQAPAQAQAQALAPLIVLFHGGYWRPKFDRTHLRPMAHALAACGYVVAMPEYRRAGMATDWSGPFDDIAAMCDQVTSLASEHGADPERVTWAGHSAGGHLALWAAARPYFPAGSKWHGPCDARHVVSLAGVSSLRLCAEWNLDDGAARNLLGGGPDDVPGRYAVADPASLTPPSVPVTIVHGTADDRVPVGMSRATGIGHLIELNGAGHFDLIDPHSRYWPRVLTAITANI